MTAVSDCWNRRKRASNWNGAVGSQRQRFADAYRDAGAEFVQASGTF